MCGGLAVSLGLQPRDVLLNDINPHSINLYRWLQRGVAASIPFENRRTVFDRYRTRFNDLVATDASDTEEAAMLFYYLNRTCYNGLCRFNRKGEFNVPFGKYKTITYTTDFSSYVKAFAGWEFRCGDFEKLALTRSDFIYADPPYDVQFTTYSKEGFSWDDQVRLATWLKEHKGPVVLSNQATDRIVALYTRLGYHLTYLNAPRLISCNGNRTPAREVLATRGV